MKSNRASLSMYGLPVIDSLGDLSEATRLSEGLLYRLISVSEKYYCIFEIPKKSGGSRRICQPALMLKAVQAWILRNILDHLCVSQACKGFTEGESILDNATPHVRGNAILCLDVEDFFPSVAAKRVAGIFRTVGYNRKVAGILTSLCTLDDGLPQGAPSSPKLANLACLRLDARLLGFAGRRGIVYTRYADDLTFSAFRSETLSRSHPVLCKIIRDEGFELNEAKTRMSGPTRQRRVTGLILNEKYAGIGRKRFRQLRSMIHQLSKVDANKVSEADLNHIRGWLAFVKGVDEVRSRMLASYIVELQEKHETSGVSRLSEQSET